MIKVALGVFFGLMLFATVAVAGFVGYSAYKENVKCEADVRWGLRKSC